VSTNPLRFEFVLTGLSFLFSVFVLAEAVDWERHHRTFSLTSAVAARGKEHDLLVLGLLTAAAYVVGIAIVQMTFFLPTTFLIRGVRQARFDELAQLDLHLRTLGSHKSDPPLGLKDLTREEMIAILPLAFDWDSRRGERTPRLERLHSRVARLYGLLRGRERPKLKAIDSRSAGFHAEGLALTIGRASAPAEVADEYRYRRSNRQIFVGSFPSVLVLWFAALVAGWRYGHWELVLAPASVIILVLLSSCLWSAAEYQEKIAQSLLLDIAFLRRWRIPLSDAPQSATASQHVDSPPTTEASDGEE
jgi:hypothetical protein